MVERQRRWIQNKYKLLHIVCTVYVAYIETTTMIWSVVAPPCYKAQRPKSLCIFHLFLSHIFVYCILTVIVSLCVHMSFGRVILNELCIIELVWMWSIECVWLCWSEMPMISMLEQQNQLKVFWKDSFLSQINFDSDIR